MTRALQQGLAELPLSLNDQQVAQLIDYLALLVKWNAVYNLTAVRDPAQMITQHLLDTLAAVPAFAGANNVLDVGAGGGLPGIVLAICGATQSPSLRVTMVDTVHKKTAFLTQVKAELGLHNVTVHTGRVEQMPAPQLFDVITSRAFADLSDFVNWSGHLLADGGRFIALKGIAPAEEIVRLPSGWKASEVRPAGRAGAGCQHEEAPGFHRTHGLKHYATNLLRIIDLDHQLKSHGKNFLCCESKGRSRQDHDRCQPGGGFGAARATCVAGRPRPAGQRNHGGRHQQGHAQRRIDL